MLVVDEAQSLPFDLLEEIRLLVNIETNEEKLLSVVLAGQPELAALLNRAELRQLKQRISLRCELRPLTQLEGFAYIAGRIRAAGGVGAHIFTREAVTLIHQRARGIPRLLSVIADNALVTGFATNQRPIRAGVVEEVCRDLDLEAALSDASEPSPEPVSDERRSMLTFTALSTGPEREASTTDLHEPQTLQTTGAVDEESQRRRFGFS